MVLSQFWNNQFTVSLDFMSSFSFLISVSLALINGKVRPLCPIKLLLFPQTSHLSSKITIFQSSRQDMYHYDNMCYTCNCLKSLHLARLFDLFLFLFLSKREIIGFSFNCPFPLGGYSRIGEMRKCKSHDVYCLHP